MKMMVSVHLLNLVVLLFDRVGQFQTSMFSIFFCDVIEVVIFYLNCGTFCRFKFCLRYSE
jgi:hypothetical protein